VIELRTVYCLIFVAGFVFLCGCSSKIETSPFTANSTQSILPDADVAALGKKLWAVNEKTGDKFNLQASLVSVTNDSEQISFRMTAYIFHMKKAEKSTSRTINMGTLTFYLLDTDGKVVFGPIVEAMDKMKPS
jgi:hypothetical protein